MMGAVHSHCGCAMSMEETGDAAQMCSSPGHAPPPASVAMDGIAVAAAAAAAYVVPVVAAVAGPRLHPPSSSHSYFVAVASQA